MKTIEPMSAAEPMMAPRSEWEASGHRGRSTGAVRVSFADARRPEEATRVRLDDFDGPLALLLALVEQCQLDVLTVRLGDLCGAYLEAIARLEGRRMSLLSAFVSVCAQLILIKSQALLPRPPAEPAVRTADDEADAEEELRQRLILYRRYRDAGRRLASEAEGRALFHRDAAAAAAAGRAGASPGPEPPLDPALLAAALRGSARLLPPPPPAARVVAREITLAERTEVLRRALRRAPAIVLQELLRDVNDRVVVAVTFMALLEMVKAGEAAIEQREPWGPISVRAPGAGDG